MTAQRTEVAGLVLVGGRSTRMGSPKALAVLAGIPLWQHAVRILEPLCAEVILLGALDGLNPGRFRVIPDDPPGVGPLGGLAAGLEQSRFDHHLLLATDYPLVRAQLLSHILDCSANVDAVCTRSTDYLEPLLGYYHSRCAPVIRQMLAEGEIRTHRLFDRVPSLVIEELEMKRFDPSLWSHINVNTPDELARAEALLNRKYPA